MTQSNSDGKLETSTMTWSAESIAATTPTGLGLRSSVEVGNVVVASMVGDWRLRRWRVVDLVETSLFPGWPRKTDY